MEYLESSGFALTSVRQQFFRVQLKKCGNFVRRDVERQVLHLRNKNPDVRLQGALGLFTLIQPGLCEGAFASMADPLLAANNDPDERISENARQALVAMVANTTPFGTRQRILRKLAEALNSEDTNESMQRNSFHALQAIIAEELNPAAVENLLVEPLRKIYENSPRTDTLRAVCATRLLKQIAQDPLVSDRVKREIGAIFEK